MPPDVPRGTIDLHGDYAHLRFERVYPHAIEHVWEAISTPEGLREWLMCTHALIEGRVGGRFDTISGAPQYHSTGKILVWDPPHRLEYERSMPTVPEMPEGQHAIFRFHLSALSDATRLVATYEHITKDAARGFLPGFTCSSIACKRSSLARRCPTGTLDSTSWRQRTPSGEAMPTQDADVFHAISPGAARAAAGLDARIRRRGFWQSWSA